VCGSEKFPLPAKQETSPLIAASVPNRTISHLWNVAVTEVQTILKLLLLAWLAPINEDLTAPLHDPDFGIHLQGNEMDPGSKTRR
jgi:hypothetical protein